MAPSPGVCVKAKDYDSSAQMQLAVVTDVRITSTALLTVALVWLQHTSTPGKLFNAPLTLGCCPAFCHRQCADNPMFHWN
jgi:hypothetical protein